MSVIRASEFDGDPVVISNKWSAEMLRDILTQSILTDFKTDIAIRKAIKVLESTPDTLSKPMTANEYQKAAMRTASGMSDQYPKIFEGLMGLNGEAGECIDLLKKHLFQGHELDREHLARELGDVAWYLAISAEAIGYDLETVFRMNIEKLKARYPEGFDAKLSKHRENGDV